MIKAFKQKLKNMKYFASFAVAAMVTAGTLVSVGAFAQSGGYKLNDKVSNFSLKDGNSKAVSLSQYAGSKAVVVVFTNNSCPYARLYENRLVTLANTYARQGVQFIFVNPSVGPGEADEKIQELAAKKFPFPYLADEGQQVSSQFGASKTPEAFVLLNNKGDFTLKYKGAIDDNPQAEANVKNYYLKQVIDEVLSNKTVTSLENRATGCMIKRN
ncbi:thioredoxin family protein [Botryobacter ruber]|uniref:thioredoxin family protein n=1 Tax=Botryobacter ruber TaxID=2171629 RepID=UPI001F0B941D|nr:thioredoxin family protein [Botryobacter ruber]